MFASNRIASLCIALASIFLLTRCSDDDAADVDGRSEGTDEGQTLVDDVRNDERLVGAWRHTDVYTSGEFTGVVDDYFWLNADGTFQEGGNAAAGDAGSGAVTGAGERGDGRWKTEDKILYVMANGSTEWFGLARYAIDDSHMLLTYGDGSKKIWERM